MTKDILHTPALEQPDADMTQPNETTLSRANKAAAICKGVATAALVGVGASLYFDRPDMALASGGLAFMSILSGVVAHCVADQSMPLSHSEIL